MKTRVTSLHFRFEANACDCGQETTPNKKGFISCGIFDIHNSGWPICSHCGDDLILVDDCEVDVPEKTLVIEGVDVGLLEKQRVALVKLSFSHPSEELTGIVNMFDEWSDNNYFREKEK